MKRLRERRSRLPKRLPPFEEVLRGSVVRRLPCCGKPGCRCATGEGEWPDHFEPFAAALDPAWIQPALSAADTQRWRGLAVDGVDGSTLRIADTPENESVFGRPGSSRGAAAYPQLRLVTRMALRAHLPAGLALGKPHPWGCR